MTEPKKFLFGHRDFSDQALEAQRHAQQNRPPSFTEADLLSTKDRAYKTGVDEGLRQQRQAQEQAIQAAMDALQRKIDMLLHHEAERYAQFERDAVALAMTMFVRLYPVVQEKLAIDQVALDMESILHQARGQSQIAVFVHPEMIDAARSRFASEENVIIHSDATLQAHDVRAEWPRGGAQIVREETLAQLRSLLERALDGYEFEIEPAEQPQIAQAGVALNPEQDRVGGHGERVGDADGEDEPAAGGE